jgi:signal transduction histidine kinase
MIKAAVTDNEEQRLEALKSYEILDSSPELDFDAITLIASQICEVPIALISLVDEKRQWFKSHRGLDATETSRDFAFCAHAILDQENYFEVQDTSLDLRFYDNPLVTDGPKIKFYTGVPIVNKDGFALGTLCVIDRVARQLTIEQKKALKALALQVIGQLELRKNLRELEEVNAQLKRKNEEISRFAYIVSHDIKAPVRGMKSVAEIILEDHSDTLNTDVKKGLNLIKNRADQLTNLVNGILNHSVLEKDEIKIETINLPEFVENIFDMISAPNDVSLKCNILVNEINTDAVYLHQIIQNLVNNALKYNDKERVEVLLTIYAEGDKVILLVKDNGIGISEVHQKKIFEIFQIIAYKDRNGMKGSGIGLATVKRLVEKLKGEISVTSSVGEGSEFKIVL